MDDTVVVVYTHNTKQFNNSGFSANYLDLGGEDTANFTALANTSVRSYHKTCWAAAACSTCRSCAPSQAVWVARTHSPGQDVLPCHVLLAPSLTRSLVHSHKLTHCPNTLRST
eukprot:SAG22_NODE_136_length_18095_cov_19.897255_20_plen_113_part_00